MTALIDRIFSDRRYLIGIVLILNFWPDVECRHFGDCKVI